MEGLEHLWPLVVGRTTCDLHSRGVISTEQGRDMDDAQLHRDLPQGPRDIRVVFHLERVPSDFELADHVPAMPIFPIQQVREVMDSLKDAPCIPAGDDITQAERCAHRQMLRTRGWIATNAMIARPVKAAELKWNTDAQTKMQEPID